MPRTLAWLALAILSAGLPHAAQNRPGVTPLRTATSRVMLVEGGMVAGKWTYRSYNSTAGLVGNDANLAPGLFCGEDVLTFEMPSTTSQNGAFDIGGSYVLDLGGAVYPVPPIVVKICGRGRAGAPTDNWEYDHNGIFAGHWADCVSRVPALVGSVIRAKRHHGTQAGYVASVVAVEQL